MNLERLLNSRYMMADEKENVVEGLRRRKNGKA